MNVTIFKKFFYKLCILKEKVRRTREFCVLRSIRLIKFYLLKFIHRMYTVDCMLLLFLSGFLNKR